ncbi:MAG: PQQ-binding-like beta-propeller repeat protein [Proteobacteria bacterium]|nr:PQQ-binding-like beta-propeller repeat protein [Pseudomonadota bacterium]
MTTLMAWSLLLGLSVRADDVHQWRGSQRNGIYPETGLLKSWPNNGPKMLWSTRGIGNGYSSAVVVKGKIYVTGEKGEKEYLTALDLNGGILWSVRYGSAYSGSYNGTRTTPTLVNGRLYVISGEGEIVAIDARKGKIIWRVDGSKAFDAEPGHWGTAESPLVFDNKVIYTPGGEETTMVALDSENGSTVWKSPSLDDIAAFVSPLLITHNGHHQIVSVTSTYVFGTRPATGEIVWKVDYKELGGWGFRKELNTNTPVYKAGRIFTTSGYDHGGLMLELNQNATKARIVREVPELDTHHGGVVLVDGFLYGSNWINNKKGNWVSIDWKTGEKKYETRWGGKGAIISAEGMLYVYEELRGKLGLLKATPNGFSVISSFRIRKGNSQHWCHPIISDGILYLRRGNVIMAFDVKAN